MEKINKGYSNANNPDILQNEEHNHSSHNYDIMTQLTNDS